MEGISAAYGRGGVRCCLRVGRPCETGGRVGVHRDTVDGWSRRRRRGSVCLLETLLVGLGSGFTWKSLFIHPLPQSSIWSLNCSARQLKNSSPKTVASSPMNLVSSLKHQSALPDEVLDGPLASVCLIT